MRHDPGGDGAQLLVPTLFSPDIVAGQIELRRVSIGGRVPDPLEQQSQRHLRRSDEILELGP